MNIIKYGQIKNKLSVKNGKSFQFMHTKEGHYDLYQYLNIYYYLRYNPTRFVSFIEK